MGLIACPETSVTNYIYTLRNIQKSEDLKPRRKGEVSHRM